MINLDKVDDMLKIFEWNENFSIQVCGWKYPFPYEIYNLPDCEKMKISGIGFADKGKMKNFKGVVFKNSFIGFFNLINEEDEVFLGIGMAPEFCSLGLGSKVLLLALRESEKLWGRKPIYLEVRDWNIRAIKCYLKAGFEICGKKETKTYAGEGCFLQMKYLFNDR